MVQTMRFYSEWFKIYHEQNFVRFFWNTLYIKDLLGLGWRRRIRESAKYASH